MITWNAGARRPYLSSAGISRAATAGFFSALVLAGSEGKAMASKMFSLDPPRWGAQLEYASREYQSITPTRQRHGTSHQYTEGLTLASKGYVYHPNLLVFDLNFDPKWEQQMQKEEPGEDSSFDNVLFDYGFSGTLFRERLLSMDLQAGQNTSTNSSSLSPTTTSQSSDYGSTLVYASKKIPTRFSYLNSEQQQTGFYSSTQASDSLRLTSSNRYQRSDTKLNADWNNRKRDARGLSQTSENASLRLNNSLDVTANRRMRLSSAASTRWAKNDAITNSIGELSESLTWQHTKPKKRLQVNSSYSARYAANRQDGKLSEDIPLDAQVSLSHRLYENLISSLNGNVGHDQFEAGSEQSYGGRLNFDYTRRIPYGSIFLNQGQNYQVTDRTITIQSSAVTRWAPEVLTFGPFGARLANRDVDLTQPIELFRADGLTYDRLDYDIVETGFFVEIRPVLGSVLYDDIANGEKVSASYTYLLDPSANLGTLSRTFGGGVFLWSALSLRYHLTLTEAEVLGGMAPTHLADDTAQNISAQFRYRWSETEITYDDEKNTAGNSLRRWQIRENISWRPRREFALTLGSTFGGIELLDTGISGDFFKLEASGQWQPQSNQQWRLLAFQSTSTTNRPDRTESTGLGLSYFRRLKLWKLEVNYRHLMDQQPLVGQERSLDTLNMTLRRELR